MRCGAVDQTVREATYVKVPNLNVHERKPPRDTPISFENGDVRCSNGRIFCGMLTGHR